MDELTVTGKSLKENLKAVAVEPEYRDVIRTVKDPLHKDGGIVVLKGNLTPDGAIIKPKAVINKKMLKHRGKAVVFTSLDDMEERINDPELKVDENSVLI